MKTPAVTLFGKELKITLDGMDVTAQVVDASLKETATTGEVVLTLVLHELPIGLPAKKVETASTYSGMSPQYAYIDEAFKYEDPVELAGPSPSAQLDEVARQMVAKKKGNPT